MEEIERILGGCCIYLWQRVDGDGLSLEGITAKVKQLGGKVSNKLTKEITHIIFQRSLGASAKELLAEDEDLRFIYRKIERFGGRMVVVSPLWLRSCETAQARTKEAKFIVPQPKRPIFLDHIEKGENKRKARKSFAARPRELVEVPDFNDSLFSSSQQIRELNASPDRQINEGKAPRANMSLPVLPDVTEGDEKRRPTKLRNAGPSSGIPSQTQRAVLEQRAGLAEYQQPGGKRGMRQLSLNFFVISKKRKLSTTDVGASLTAQQHTMAREVQDDKGIGAEAGAAACKSGRQTDALLELKSHNLSVVPPTLDPPSEAQQGVTLKGVCSATLSFVAEGATLTTSAAAAAAAAEVCTKPAMLALTPPANSRPLSVLPPRVPASQNTDGGVGADRGGITAAAVAGAMEPLMTNSVATEPDATSVVPGPNANSESAPLADTLPPGLHTAPRTSSRRRSCSLGGTPFAPGLVKSIGRLTPLATPKGLTPGSLVMPKLKTQGGGGVTAAASVIPSGPSKALVRPIAELLPEMDVRAAGSCAIVAVAGGTIKEPVLGSEQGAFLASAHTDVATAVAASIRRSARIRGLLPPTPPPPMQAQAQEAPDDLGPGPVGAAVSRTPGMGSTAVVAARPMASLGGSGNGFTEGLGKIGCEGGFSRDLDGPTEGLRGDGLGTATCQRSQQKTGITTPKPLPLSPVADESAPEGDAALKSPAGRGRPSNACKSANHLTPAGSTALISLAQPCMASIPRRSARLASIFQDLQLGNGHDPGAEHGAATKAIAEQQHQHPHDVPMPNFHTASQQPLRNTAPTPGKKPCWKIASLLQDAAWAMAEEDRVAAANCTRATACKSRCKQVLNEEEPGKQVQREVQLPLLSIQEPVRQREESPRMAPVDLVVRATTPASALCTRSRTRAAAMISGMAQVNIAPQQQRQEFQGRPSPHPAKGPLADSGNEQSGNGVCGTSSKLKPERLQFAPHRSPSPTGYMPSALAPPRTGTEAAWQRPGSVTRSRCRALELERADAAQAPPSTAAKRSRGSFTRTAALLKAAAASPPNDAKAHQAEISGSDATPGRLCARVPTRGSTTGHTETAALLEPQPVAATPVAPLIGEFADSDANHRTIGPQLMAAPPAVAKGGYCLAAVGDQIPPRPPRTSRRKRPHETPAVEPPEKSSESSNGASARPVDACRGQGVMPNMAEGGDEGARNDQTSANANGVKDLLRGIPPNPSVVIAAAVIDEMQSAQQPAEAARSVLGPAQRSRLRLRRQAPAPHAPTMNALGQAGSVALQGATPVTASLAASNHRTHKSRKTLPSSSKADETETTTAVATVTAAPATALIPGTGDCPEAPVSSPVAAKESLPGPSLPIPTQAALGNGERKVAAIRPCIATDERKLAPPSQPCAPAAAWRPLHLQRGLFLSLTLPKATATASASMLWKMPVSLGAGNGAKIVRSTSVAAAQSIREPSRTANTEALVASLAPALGQYPRGKEHPMRAGYRYLACTQVVEEMKATIDRAVRQLGGARQCTPGYEDGHITHLVVGDVSVRTIKVLLGIANGAIFVAPSWVEASLAAGEWVPEEQHLVQGSFAAAAHAVRACMQATQQQRSVGVGGGAQASSLSQGGGPSGVVVAKPLMGKMVAVHGSQSNGSRLADLQKKKAEAETIVKALGGRLGPFRSAELVILLRGSAAPQTDRRYVKTASEEWLLRLAETHIWQDP